MNNNRVINFAIRFTKGILVLVLLFLVLFIAAFVHWHFEPTAYNHVDISSGFEAGFGINKVKISLTEIPSEAIKLSELSYGMVYWLLLRNLLFFIITILIFLRILKILYSIRAIHTFYDENIHHFRRLGLLGFISFILSCFNFYYLEGNFNMNFTVAFAPLLFSVACYVMAEIFTEGKYLQEDKNQII